MTEDMPVNSRKLVASEWNIMILLEYPVLFEKMFRYKPYYIFVLVLFCSDNFIYFFVCMYSYLLGILHV